MRNMQRPGYFTTWQYDNKAGTSSHRIYYNDIDIATANLLCDGVVVGNAKLTNHKMVEIDRKCNYMW